MSLAGDRRAVAEIDRRLAQLLQFGTIAEVDPGRALMRVALGGEAKTDWIPWFAGRAGDARFVSVPSVGEQVMVFAPSGNPAHAVAMPGLYSGQAGAPAGAAGVTRLEFPSGVSVEVSGGAVSLVAPGGVSITGDVTVQGDVVADGISLKQHVHGGVIRGGSKTNPPE